MRFKVGASNGYAARWDLQLMVNRGLGSDGFCSSINFVWWDNFWVKKFSQQFINFPFVLGLSN
jgi:hypothetical protein